MKDYEQDFVGKLSKYVLESFQRIIHNKQIGKLNVFECESYNLKVKENEKKKGMYTVQRGGLPVDSM